jgi:hypothetical protein
MRTMQTLTRSQHSVPHHGGGAAAHNPLERLDEAAAAAREGDRQRQPLRRQHSHPRDDEEDADDFAEDTALYLAAEAGTVTPTYGGEQSDGVNEYEDAITHGRSSSRLSMLDARAAAPHEHQEVDNDRQARSIYAR